MSPARRPRTINNPNPPEPVPEIEPVEEEVKPYRVLNKDNFCFTRTVVLEMNRSVLELGEDLEFGEANQDSNLLKIEPDPFNVLTCSTNGTMFNMWKIMYEEKQENEEDEVIILLMNEPYQSMMIGIDVCLTSSGALLGKQGFPPCLLKTNHKLSITSLPPFRPTLARLQEKDCLQLRITFRHFSDIVILPESEDTFQLYRQDAIWRMWNLKLMSDVTVKAEDDAEFPVHKSVLGVWSTVFERMLGTEMEESDLSEINISDFSSESVKCFLKYLYGENVQKGCRNNAEELLSMAEKYQVAELKSDCEDWLVGQVSFSSVCQLLVLADLNRAEKLEKTCIDFIIKHREDIIVLDAWKELRNNHDGSFQKVVDALFGSISI